MTKISKDIPMHEGLTVADRLKSARTEIGMTRKALSEVTGVPSSTLEKYERGDMDPNTTRLQTICEKLNVSVSWVLNGEDMPNVSATGKTAKTQASANVAETSTELFAEPVSEPTEQDSSAKRSNNLDSVRGILSVLKNLRRRGFDGFQREVLALINEIRAKLKYFNPEDLMTLAFEQGLYQDENCLDASGIQNLFADDLEKGQAYCGNIEERILDTAIFGIDLFNLEVEPLHAIGEDVPDNIDLDKPDGWAEDWSEEHDIFVPHVRTAFRKIAFTGNAIDFQNEDTFPKRKIKTHPDGRDNSEVNSGIGFF